MTLKRHRLKNKSNDKPKVHYGLVTHQVLNKTDRKKLVNSGHIEKGKYEYYLDCPIEKLKEVLLELVNTNNFLSKFRIYEGNLRVRDFSFTNVQLDYREDGSIEFKFGFKGDPNNQVYFNSDSDIYINESTGLALIYVNNPVYFFDGTQRYSQEFNN